MSKQIINITRLFTIKDIPILLKITKAKFFQENQPYQQKLINYVLSQIDRRYMSI